MVKTEAEAKNKTLKNIAKALEIKQFHIGEVINPEIEAIDMHFTIGNEEFPVTITVTPVDSWRVGDKGFCFNVEIETKDFKGEKVYLVKAESYDYFEAIDIIKSFISSK